MKKTIYLNDQATENLVAGVKQLADAVKVTLGPKGRNVAWKKQIRYPKVTKDGVSVAREIFLEDDVQDIGAQMVKEVAEKTNELAGDGTTTATVLAWEIVNRGLREKKDGKNPIFIKKGMDYASDLVIDYIRKKAREVSNKEEVQNIATISGNGDREIGAWVADAFEKVGKTGIVTVQESRGRDTHLTLVEGMKFDRGYISPNFITDSEKLWAQYENPLILLTDLDMDKIQPLEHIFDYVIQQNRPLLIIANDVKDEVLPALVVNKLRNIIKVVAVKTPEYGEHKKAMLEDIAILTGATAITKESGYTFSSMDESFFGTCDSVTVAQESTTIIGGKGGPEKIKARVNEIKTALSIVESEYQREKLTERLAKLDSGVAVIYVGANSESEMEEKKDRVIDAVEATKAALAYGIVPGGGSMFCKSTSILDEILEKESHDQDFKTGIDILRDALFGPFQTIMDNAGILNSLSIDQIMGDDNSGFDAVNGKYIEDMYNAGIIDPVKVLVTALENAVSVAGMILTTECVLVEIPENNNNY